MKYPEFKEPKKIRLLPTNQIIFSIIGILTVIALILIVIFTVRDQKQAKGTNLATYSSADQEKPTAKTSNLFSDLGVIKVSQEKGASFNIVNSGSKPLQLFKITSSCGCTVGKITIGGKTSPEFGMHSKSNWTAELAPGQNAKVDVIYRPYIMPVKGDVTRDVYISTNDPDNQLLTFTVKANVQ